MQRVKDITRSILWEKAKTFPSFRIPRERVLGSKVTDAEAFVKDETYFEIRLSQMHLQDRRQLWAEYIPTASFMVEFLFDGRAQVVPYVVSRDTLKSAISGDASGTVEQLNTRIVGPYPYVGDDVRFFAGLFKTKVRDFAEPALGFLETVAKAFDVTKLTSFIPVAEPLLSGIETILGLPGVEMLIGMQRTYELPGGSHDVSAESFTPGYEVMLSPDAHAGTEAEKASFWVKEGRLHIGEGESSLKEFRDADFMLIRVAALSERDDYSKLDFHRLWDQADEQIWAGNESAARRTYNELLSHLGHSKDLVYPQRNGLLELYPRKFEEEVRRHKEASRRVGRRFEGGATRLQISEMDLRLAALRRVNSRDFGPASGDGAIAAFAGQ